MTGNIPRARKAALIKILAERDLQIKELEKTVSELREHGKVNSLSLESFESAGSIAEASLQVSNIFSAAQESADRYLESIREIERNSKLEAERIIAEARSEAASLINAAEQKCAAREIEEKQNIDALWADLHAKLLDFHERYSELGDLFAKMNFRE